jgi:hypothetical protein
MSASQKEQTAILLETIPFELDHSSLVAAVNGLALADLQTYVANARKLQALDAIKSVEDFIYKERTGINRDVKTKRAHAQELRASLGPAGDKTEWQAEAARLLKDLQNNASDKAVQLQQAESDYGNAKKDVACQCEMDRSEIDRQIDDEISRLNRLRSERKAAVATTEKNHLLKLAEVHKDNLASVEATFQPEHERLTLAHDRAQQNASQQERLKQTVVIAKQNDTEADALDVKSKAITKALDRLDALREGLLEKLPIRGLKIEGGRAYLGGIPLEEVNTAERGKFWVRIAVMRAMAKDLGIVLIDDAEHFDSDNFAMLLDACKSSGLQFFISRVEDHPFRIQRVA